MSRIIRMEWKNGVSSVTVEAQTDPSKIVPPPEGWSRTGIGITGDDVCIVEDLLVRGFLNPRDPAMLFALAPAERRQDLTHEQEIEGIVARCRPHGITVEPGEIIDVEHSPITDGFLRTFRGWRMSGEGCPSASPEIEYTTIVREDGRIVCNACGQEPIAGTAGPTAAE